MHEVSICESMLRLIEDAAAEHGFGRVTRVRVEVGAFSCVEPDALRFGFDAVMKGSPAEGACLEIIPRPGRAFCSRCRETVPVDERLAPCPACGATGLLASGGDELRIKDLEVV